MKVIDLLNKIANNEEVPERIRVLGNEFEYDNYDLKYRNTECGRDNLFEHIGFYKGIVVNTEVEIIENTPKEDKKIEPITEEVWELNYSIFKNKINEIIDRVNGE